MLYIVLLLLSIPFGMGLYKLFEKIGLREFSTQLKPETKSHKKAEKAKKGALKSTVSKRKDAAQPLPIGETSSYHVKGWQAAVPGLNMFVWNKVVGRPSWKLVLLLIPLVNIFVVAYMLIDLAKSFGKHDFLDHLAAVIVPFIYFPMLGFNKNVQYKGQGALIPSPYKKSVIREWSEAVIFAVFAATFIRMFLIEAYTIPSPSMENSLLVGDFLFVSKVNYGCRMPMTPIQFPLFHNKLPIVGSESYSKLIKWKYKRTKGFQKVKRYDPVVFNFPEGDTIAVAQRTPAMMKIVNGDPYREAAYFGKMKRTHYYGYVRDPAMGQKFVEENFKLIERPVDKRDNYIKRCVGVSGDKIEIRNGVLFVNGEEAKKPDGLQSRYQVYTKGGVLSEKALKNKSISILGQSSATVYHMNLNKEKLAYINSLSEVDKALPYLMPASYADNSVFPHDTANYKFNVDNFGPVTIPTEGETVQLNAQNIALYKRIIKTYEGNDFEMKNGQIIINGSPATSYTFKMNYYWMMGDNRHNSEDSRIWGFVPEDHIVGKPLFIWMSIKDRSLFKGGIRFNRIFKGANGMK